MAAPPLITSPITVATILTSLRPQLPDPTINPATGLQDPTINTANDGARYSNATLIAWIVDALRETVHRTGWLVEDWWPFQAVVGQPWYKLDQRWHSIEAAFAYRFPLWPLPEPWQMYPATGSSTPPFWYGTHNRLGVMGVYMYPSPGTADPVTTITSGAMGTTDLTVTVASTTSFLSAGGYLQIDNEIMEYSSFVAATGVVTLFNRGSCGTKAATHNNASNVYHLSLWIKGYRTPFPPALVTDTIEVPEALLMPIYLYVRMLAKQAEQDDQAEGLLAQRYDAAVLAIRSDPRWQDDLSDGLRQVRAYGAQPGGGLYPMGPFGTIVP